MSQGSEYASGYARSHRIYESVGIAVGACAFGTLGVKLWQAPRLSGWWVPLTVFIGMLGADFVSGFVHWLFDTWGSTTTPVVGQLAIRTFREHHDDAKSITRHDFIETNGHNIALSILCSVGGCAALQSGTFFSLLVAMSCFFWALFVGMTSQIHKWAHMGAPPRAVRWLQDVGLLLSTPHHDVHHRAPHETHYCITVGWLNRPLAAIRFFEGLERLVTALTGVLPRASEQGAGAAESAELNAEV